MHKQLALAIGLMIAPTMVSAAATSERYVAITGGKPVGHVYADTSAGRTVIDYDVKDNGRGPTIAETVMIGRDGLPTEWNVTGATTFGSKVDEHFRLTGNTATWTDSTGKGSATVTAPSLYVAQSASPWALGVLARALLADADHQMPALPGGTLKLDKIEDLTVTGKGGSIPVTAYALIGISTDPETLILDGNGGLFATLSPRFIVIREGYEGEQVRLRGLAAKWEADRFVAIQKRVAHRYAAPVRITNVRLFDPMTQALTVPMQVIIRGRQITGVEPADSPATPGEVSIDGGGGTLVPGMFEMHAHLSQDAALLDIAAGITSVRDMGNDNAVLDDLIDRIDSGVIAGPRVVRSGFIEGKSPFSAHNGIVVDSEAAALDAVRWYGARGFWQVKSYNSMNPAWEPALVAEAHRLGMRVAGHVPAFSTADAMIDAGFDEMTHINQFMLGWVLTPQEDTRSLLRLTAMKRFATLDLNSPKVQKTIGMMVDRKVAFDPTIGIHEKLTLNRDGQVPPGSVDYFDHMPIGWQRDEKQALTDTSAPGDDKAYRDAFAKILACVRMLNDRGIFIVPGTDTGGSFTYHRELELMQSIGMTPPQVLKRATWDMAKYTGQDQQLGSIAKGKLADFFLIAGDPTKNLKAVKAIRMVAKDGVIYFPSEVYPEFGIKPFATAPKVVEPKG